MQDERSEPRVACILSFLAVELIGALKFTYDRSKASHPPDTLSVHWEGLPSD
jgi:hypothetical protein